MPLENEPCINDSKFTYLESYNTFSQNLGKQKVAGGGGMGGGGL